MQLLSAIMYQPLIEKLILPALMPSLAPLHANFLLHFIQLLSV
jgi:hypothetical protein